MKQKRPKQTYPLVEVWWDDATHIEMGWKTREEFLKEKDEAEMVLTVGFLIKETPNHIYVAMDTDKEGQHNQRAMIPTGMIKKIKVIRKEDKENGTISNSSNSNASGTQ